MVSIAVSTVALHWPDDDVSEGDTVKVCAEVIEPSNCSVKFPFDIVITYKYGNGYSNST